MSKKRVRAQAKKIERTESSRLKEVVNEKGQTTFSVVGEKNDPVIVGPAPDNSLGVVLERLACAIEKNTHISVSIEDTRADEKPVVVKPNIEVKQPEIYVKPTPINLPAQPRPVVNLSNKFDLVPIYFLLVILVLIFLADLVLKIWQFQTS